MADISLNNVVVPQGSITLEAAYKILGLPYKLKNIDELKKHYHDLTLIYHPDRPNGNSKMMAIINCAQDLIEDFICSDILQPESTNVLENFETVKNAIIKKQNIIIRYLDDYVCSQTAPIVSFEESVDQNAAMFSITTHIAFQEIEFVFKIKSLSASASKIFLHFNSKYIKNGFQQILVHENNRRISVEDISQPEFFFPENELYKLFPPDLPTYSIAGMKAASTIFQSIDAQRLNSTSFKIDLDSDRYIIVHKNVDAILKTPTWSIYGIYNSRHEIVQEITTIPYIETFDSISIGGNLNKLLQDIQKLQQ